MAKLKLLPARRTGIRWVDGAVIYQIYPRSFQDSNGDGIGDIPGIIQRLDYLKELGVSGVWISPFYPSPMADFGYDVADYRDIDPMFGTLDDFKRLLAEAHSRDIQVIIDIVPNHTSDEHPWFEESRKSRDNRYADWYTWKDPAGYKNGKPVPPNNWLGMFDGKSAWQWVPEREQFYLHTFHTRQPDLNWENPAVRGAIKDVLRYWLDMGVDGFRVDAVSFLAKDPEYHDDPPNPHFNPNRDDPYNALEHINCQFWPQLYSHLRELADVLYEKPYRDRPRFMVTEAYLPREDVIGGYLQFYRAMNPRVGAPFIFEGISRPWDARDWHAFLRDFHGMLDGFNPLAMPSYAFGNHDQSRLVSRYGAERARAVAVLQFSLPGMIFVYNGEEIGMHDVEIPASAVQDPGAVGGSGRDPERTPMQWNTEPGAGFTTGKPWLPLARDYKKENVEVQAVDPNSFLSLYRHLARLRNNTAALRHGKLQTQDSTTEHLLAFSRKQGREHYTTVVNFADAKTDYFFDRPGIVVVSSLDGQPSHTVHRTSLRLRPHEAVIIKHI